MSGQDFRTDMPRTVLDSAPARMPDWTRRRPVLDYTLPERTGNDTWTKNRPPYGGPPEPDTHRA